MTRLIIVKLLKTKDKESGDRVYCIQFSATRSVCFNNETIGIDLDTNPCVH